MTGEVTPLVIVQALKGGVTRETSRFRPSLEDNFFVSVATHVFLAGQVVENPDEIIVRILRPVKE